VDLSWSPGLRCFFELLPRLGFKVETRKVAVNRLTHSMLETASLLMPAGLKWKVRANEQLDWTWKSLIVQVHSSNAWIEYLVAVRWVFRYGGMYSTNFFNLYPVAISLETSTAKVLVVRVTFYPLVSPRFYDPLLSDAFHLKFLLSQIHAGIALIRHLVLQCRVHTGVTGEETERFWQIIVD
jgi:hypothetical protein